MKCIICLQEIRAGEYYRIGDGKFPIHTDAYQCVKSAARRCAEIAKAKADECAGFGAIVGEATADDIMLSIEKEFLLVPHV